MAEAPWRQAVAPPVPGAKYKSDFADQRAEPPPCVQNAMLTKDKKPFTYTPGGIDLSEIRSPRMARRLERNAMSEGVTPPQQGHPNQTRGPLPPSALAAMQPQLPVQVFPPGKIPPLHGAPPPPPPPPPPMKSQPPLPLDGLERPDMTKIIPDNPMALLRKTSGPVVKQDPILNKQNRPNQSAPMESPPASPIRAPPAFYKRQPSVQQNEPGTPPYSPQPKTSAFEGVRSESPKSPPWLKRNPSQEVPEWAVNQQVSNEEVQRPKQQRPWAQKSVEKDERDGWERQTEPQQQQRNEQVKSEPQQRQWFERNEPQRQQPQQRQWNEPQRQQAWSETQQPRDEPQQRQWNEPQRSQPWSGSREPRNEPQQKQWNEPQRQQPWSETQQQPRNEPQQRHEPQRQWNEPKSEPQRQWAEQQRNEPQRHPEPHQQQTWKQPQPEPQTWRSPQQTNPVGGVRNQVKNRETPQEYHPNEKVEVVIVNDPPTVFQHRGGPNQGGVRIIPVQIEGTTSNGHNLLNRQLSQPTQSNTFKVLQKITNTNEDDREDEVAVEHSPIRTGNFPRSQGDQELLNKFRQGIDEDNSIHKETDPRYRGPSIPSKAFKLLQSMTGGGDEPLTPNSVPQENNRGPKVRNIPIQIEGETRSFIPPSEQTVPEPKKYTGSSIPSRSFRILQAMTSPDPCGPGQSDL